MQDDICSIQKIFINISFLYETIIINILEKEIHSCFPTYYINNICIIHIMKHAEVYYNLYVYLGIFMKLDHYR